MQHFAMKHVVLCTEPRLRPTAAAFAHEWPLRFAWRWYPHGVVVNNSSKRWTPHLWLETCPAWQMLNSVCGVGAVMGVGASKEIIRIITSNTPRRKSKEIPKSSRKQWEPDKQRHNRNPYQSFCLPAPGSLDLEEEWSIDFNFLSTFSLFFNAFFNNRPDQKRNFIQILFCLRSPKHGNKCDPTYYVRRQP